MPTPVSFAELWKEHQALKRAAFHVLNATGAQETREAREELWELAGDYEPTETEQGLVPIPNEYAEV